MMRCCALPSTVIPPGWAITGILKWYFWGVTLFCGGCRRSQARMNPEQAARLHTFVTHLSDCSQCELRARGDRPSPCRWPSQGGTCGLLMFIQKCPTSVFVPPSSWTHTHTHTHSPQYALTNLHSLTLSWALLVDVIPSYYSLHASYSNVPPRVSVAVIFALHHTYILQLKPPLESLLKGTAARTASTREKKTKKT